MPNTPHVDQIELRQKRNIGDIINASFDFIGKHWKNIVKPMLILLLPLIIVQAILTAFYLSEISAMSQPNIEQQMEASHLMAMFIPLLLLSIIGFVSLALILSVGYSYMIVYQQAGTDNLDDTRYIIRKALNNFWLVLGYSIGFSVIIVGIYILSMLFLVVSPFLIILSLPLIIFVFVRFSLVIVAGLDQREGFFKALGKSWQLTKGKFWFTFGLVLVIMLIQMSVSMVFYLPSMFLSLSGDFTQMIDSNVFFTILYTLVSALFSIVVTVLYIIHTTSHVILYFSLLEEKEGTGMMEKIASIGSDDSVAGEDIKDVAPKTDPDFRNYFR